MRATPAALAALHMTQAQVRLLPRSLGLVARVETKDEGSRIVCTVTGHGLKDPDIAREQCGNVIPAKAEKAEILRHIAG